MSFAAQHSEDKDASNEQTLQMMGNSLRSKYTYHSILREAAEDVQGIRLVVQISRCDRWLCRKGYESAASAVEVRSADILLPCLLV